MREATPSRLVGADMNIFIDIGGNDDDRFLVEGASERENWGKLPPEAFGATNRDHTVRWTPAAGNTTTFILPSSPNRDHLLRFAGSAIRNNLVTVRVNGQEAGSISVAEGYKQYEHRIPAAMIGESRMIELQLIYAQRHVPQEIDSHRWPNETRVCNLALDWLQFSTANVPPSHEQNFTFPQEQIVFSSDAPPPLSKRVMTVPHRRHARLMHPQAKVLARYATDGAPHTMLLPVGKNHVALVNGSLGSVADRDYLDTLVTQWAQVEVPHRILAESVQGTVLTAGKTLLPLAYNNDVTHSRTVKFRIQIGQQPVAEVRRLSVDGHAGGEVKFRTAGGVLTFEDNLRYCGVYEVALCAVRLDTPELLLHPGEKREVMVTLTNRTAAPVAGTVNLESIIPTLRSNVVSFTLPANSSRKFALHLEAKPTVDWGLKTVTFKITTKSGAAYFWRALRIERNPDLRPAVQAISSRQPQLPVGNVENGFVRNATAHHVRIERIQGKAVVSYGEIRSGEVGVQTIPVPEASQPAIAEQQALLLYELWGQTVQQPIRVRVANLPRLDSRPSEAPHDAVARLLVANASDDYLENYVLTIPIAELRLPGGVANSSLFVREIGGSVVPSQVDAGGYFSCLTMLPPRSVNTLWICQGEREAIPTDLQIEAENLGSGRGVVTLRNSKLSLTLDEARGGTVTSFVSVGSGVDYGTGSFGIAYGSFGTFDPLKPAVKADEFIREKKVYQREKPGKIRLLTRGPLRAVVEVEWSDAQIQAKQTFELRAYADHFRLRTRLVSQKVREDDEIVVLDARFRRNQFTKIFPNFTGLPEVFSQDKPHFGWRQGPYVPPVATLMTLPDSPESLSLIVRRRQGVDAFRQGFWPEKRPMPGAAVFAHLEYLAHSSGTVELDLFVKLHRGHQRVAQLWQRHLDEPPLTAVDPLPRVSSAPASSSTKPAHTRDPAWWNPYWHYRAPVIFSAPSVRDERQQADARGMVVAFNLTSWLVARGQTLDENSLRLLEYSPEGILRGQVSACWERPADFDAAKNAVGKLICTSVPTKARYYLYFDTTAHGTKMASLAPIHHLLDWSFDADPSGWRMDRARLVHGAGRRGACGRLSLPQANGLSLLANNTMPVLPHARYRLSFWARTSDAGLVMRANFYLDAKHDFPQVPIPLTPDGAWHEYTVTLPTGDFPLSVRPFLRLWLINQAGSVDVDDVHIELADGALERMPSGQLGEVEEQ